MNFKSKQMGHLNFEEFFNFKNLKNTEITVLIPQY